MTQLLRLKATISQFRHIRCFLLMLFVIGVGLHASAQGVVVSGMVQSAADTTALPGAMVLLEKAAEASSPAATLTDVDGKFRFEKVAPGQYTLKIDYLGFRAITRTLRVQGEPVRVGTIKLQEEATTMRAVEVVGQVALGDQLGDTTQFNAQAFKVNPNASAEDLVQKMPGIEIQDGKIQAQGEDIQEILVDGKRFFEGDVEAALRNLPAEVIAKIQIFDKKSDQAEFSGFDDGNRAKTINIVTKPERRRGQFGQASAGYGTDRRFMLGASVNFFDGDRRLTVTGIRNNINMSDYSIGETPGGGMRGRRGGANGIITSNRLGLNFSDQWGDKVELSGNYTFNHTENEQGQYKVQNYILTTDSADTGRIYTEKSNGSNASTSHRFRMRLKYALNERNEILFKPNFSFQKGSSINYFFGRTINDLGPVNQSENNSNAVNEGFNGESDIHFRHRFLKKGRTFAASLNNQYSSDNGESYRKAENYFYNRINPYEPLDQYRNSYGSGYSWEVNTSFTEPIGENARMQLEYAVGNRVNDDDRRTFLLAELTGNYTLLDTALSNTFRSEYLTQEVELGYQYSIEKLRVEVEAEYQKADLQNDQQFPEPYHMNRTFHSLLPSAELEYKFTESKNLRIDYRANTSAPSLHQLRDVIDQSNPLHLRSGNPNLKQSYQNRLSMRYRSFNKETNHVFYMGVRGSITNNIISNSTLIAADSMRLTGNILLEKGAQFTRPVNLDEANWDLRTYFNYGQPIDLIQSKISFSGSIGYARRPGVINNKLNISNGTNFRAGISLSSNISEKIDFHVATHSNYNLVQNTLLPERNNNYFNQSTRLRFNWIFWEGLVYRTELNHQVNTGLTAGYDNSFLLWNMSISKKLFANERGEISLSVNDLLEQNNNIRRNVTEVYIEDVRADILQRYFMLTFTYSLRNFSGGN